MPEAPLTHVPVAVGLAYIERIQRLPSRFTATLVVEPDNRFSRAAVAVHANGEKVGYLPPEISRHYFEPVRTAGAPVECPARRAPVSEREDTGVELLLDFSALAVAPAD
ncbi:MAG TPA: hypothetical protein VFX12_01065 [Vicinamibacterales bacterium]|nr:hypothetical protein [Vicinamibacterales bacterium]